MNLNSLFIPYLKESETIEWTGKPKSGFQLRDADIILIPSSIILIGFSIILNYIDFIYDSPFVFKVLGIFLALLGIYMSSIRFLIASWKRNHTFYCITSRRVLVISGRKKKLKTLPLKNITQLDSTEEKDGSGFLIFGNVNPLWPWLLGGFYMTSENVPGLEMLPDVNLVRDILEKRIKIEMPDALIEKINSGSKEELN